MQLDDDEKHSIEESNAIPTSSSQDNDINNVNVNSNNLNNQQSTRLTSFYSNLKHLFPLTKSRSATASPTPPTIVTTSPTTPIDPSSSIDLPNVPRQSTSTLGDTGDVGSSASSARSSHSLNMVIPSGNASRTHLHVLTSATMAAVIGTNRIHFDDNVSIRTSSERSPTPVSPTIRISSASNVPAETTGSSTASSISSKDKFLQKFIPSHLMRRSHRQRRKNHSIHSISIPPVLPLSPIIHSAPTSPKLSAQKNTVSARSSAEDRPRLLPLPLPALQPSESLPSRQSMLGLNSSAMVVSRGRSSTVSSVSSDISPRMSRSRSRRASTIFGNLKGRESGRGTPVEKLSLDIDDDNHYSLPPVIPEESGQEYFRRLLGEEGGLSKWIRKLVESNDNVHLDALRAYLATIPFEGLPLDMAMRFLLLHLPLPKEQGSIYRLLELFAERYHTCNPGLWDSFDQILVVCYSILMLNTDAWNSNNKVKMTREQYLKNTSGQGVAEDILSCWFDNVTLTPFIDSTHSLSKLRVSSPSIEKPTKGLSDIYNPLLDSRLDEYKIRLSQNGKEFSRVIQNYLHYAGTRAGLPIPQIHAHIESADTVTLLNRSRAKSEGFALNRITGPGEPSRLIKVGIFSKRERVSRFGRMSGWQWVEIGVLLLDTKIIFVRGDLSGVKSLIGLLSEENEEDVIIPPLGSEMTFDMVGAIAFYDTSITFGTTGYILRLVSSSGTSEILSLPGETELNEWIALINYLAATQTALTPPADPLLSPAMLRRRAGTIMTTTQGRPLPLRAVSSTLELRGRSKSEQPPLPPIPIDKLALYTSFHDELEKKLHFQRVAVDSLVRQVKGLLIQTPILERTKLTMTTALERVTKRLKVARVELERARAYLDILRDVISFMKENKVRLVEAETEEFQLPSLGFIAGSAGHRRNSPSEETVDTMLSSTTLYTALNPVDGEDLGIPVRRIGEPSRTVTIGASPTKRTMMDGTEGIEVDVPEIVVGKDDTSPLEKWESAPGIMDTSTKQIPAPVSSKVENQLSPRVAEITRIVREGGF